MKRIPISDDHGVRHVSEGQIRETFRNLGLDYGPSFDDGETDMSDEIDVKAPWWKVGRYPAVDSHFNYNWGKLAMTIQALNGGPAVIDFVFKASLGADIKFKDFKAGFETEFPTFRAVLDDQDLDSPRATQVTYVDADVSVLMDFDGDLRVGVRGSTTSKRVFETIKTYFGAQTTTDLPRGRVHVVASTSHGPEFHSLGVGGLALERGNYDAAVLAGFDRIVEDLGAASPGGRVAILNGPPGTGKTFITRGILDAVKNVTFVIVPANMVTEMAQPTMIPALMNLHQDCGERPVVFIIEDADECLAPRMGDNMSAVSTVLNLGDGILGQLLDIRILATTNAHRQELDEAIMRPGRLSANVEVGTLAPEQATAIMKRLGSDDVATAAMTLAEIYQRVRDATWKPSARPQPMGFGTL